MAFLVRMRLPWGLGAVVVSGFALMPSCSDGSVERDTQSAHQAIFYGTSDTEREAVMALIHAPNLETIAGSCSGTNIQSADGFGYLLTAAHCVGERDQQGELMVPFSPIPPGDLVVLPGFDWAEATDAFVVQDYVVHPDYDTNTDNPNDLALVRFYFGGADPLPTIAPLLPSEDDLSTGDPFTLVGFGRTDTNDFNTERNQVQRNIAQLATYWVVHSQDGGGTCMGDSGGPGIVTVGSEERIAVVSSAVGNSGGGDPCETGSGFGVRVSAYQSFIDDYLAQAPDDASCDACLVQAENNACSGASDNCLTGSPCGDYLGCVELCQTTACVLDCSVQHQQGLVDYFELLLCSCGACEECASEPVCEEFECGYSNTGDWCGCVRDGCCAEGLACSRDATCLACSTVEGFELGCDENEPLSEFISCIDGCEEECTLSTGDTGSTSTTSTTGTSSTSGSTGDSGGTTGTGGGIDMVNWRDLGDDDSAGDAGVVDDGDAGVPDEPDAGDTEEGAAGASGSDEDDDKSAAPAQSQAQSQGGCGCRIDGRRGTTPPVLLLLGGLVAFGARRQRSRAI